MQAPPLSDVVLERSPLAYFLAQVRFARILSMERHLPAIQDTLRRIGFSVFTTTMVPVLEVDAGQARLENQAVWHFNDVDGRVGIVLTHGSVALQTTRYERFEAMTKRLLEAVEGIHAILEIDVMQRCGLRYVNVVHPEAGEDFRTYFQPEVTGLSSQIPQVTPTVQNSLFLGTTEYGTLMIRFSTALSPNVMPVDLGPLSLNVTLPFPDGERVATLDLDHFAEKQEQFTIAGAATTLGKLHDACWRAFTTCITMEARERWGEKYV